MHPILALETSTTTCGVALYCQTELSEWVVVREVTGVSGHAPNILPLVDELLRESGQRRHELSAVAFGQGPGAFTGVRLACSVAQGLGFALDLPVVPVGALPALAASLPKTHEPCIRLVAIDARMDEMYLAVYGQTAAVDLHELQSPVLIRAADCLAFIEQRLKYWIRALDCPPRQLIIAGDGWQLIDPGQLPSMAGYARPEISLPILDLSVDAARVKVVDIARLGWRMLGRGLRVQPEHALPLYLRDKVAFTTDERTHGLGGNPKAGSRQATGDPVLVLPMGLSDLPEVVELERQSQAFPWSEGHFKDALGSGYPGWVVRQSDVLLGFCVAMPAPDDVHLLVIAVHPAARRRGLGAMLLAQVEMLGRQQLASRILLEVRPSNQTAIEFYQGHGFKKIATRRDYYPAAKERREDAWVMAWDLYGDDLGHD